MCCSNCCVDGLDYWTSALCKHNYYISTIVRTRNSECESSRTPLIIGVTIGIIGVLVGTSGLIITCITVKQR